MGKRIAVFSTGIGGCFSPNIETVESKFWSLNEIPPLAEEKNNIEQIEMCFAAYQNEKWEVQFD